NGSNVLVTSNAPICEGGPLIVTVNSSSILSVSWQGPGGFTNTNVSFQRDTAQASFSGTYSVTVMNTFSCINHGSISLNVLPNPTLSTVSSTVCLYQPARVIAHGADFYNWTAPDGFSMNSATL